MTTITTIQSSINKAAAAKAAAKLIADKYPELLKEPTLSQFVKLLT
jgi:hypothetical protein